MSTNVFKRYFAGGLVPFFARILLGGIFIVAAVFKLPHQSEFIQIVQGYGLLPSSLAELYAVLLPWTELLLGLVLLLGFFPRISAAFLSLITLSFLIANSYVLQGPGTGGLCGCFGNLIPLTHTQSFVTDIVMLLMAVPILVTQTHRFTMSPRILTGYTVKVCAVFVAVVMLASLIPSTFVPAAAGQNTAPGEETAITSGTLGDFITADKPFLIFFHADFCSYCQEQKPVIDELEAEYRDTVSFVRFSTADNRDLVKDWGIETIPTIVLAYSLNTTDECTRFTGLTDRQDLAGALDAMLAETCPAPVDTVVQTAERATNDEPRLDSLIDSSLINNTPVFLFFHADYCHYCQEQKPIIDELEGIYGGRITFIRAESSEYPEELLEWGVTGYPDMFLISDYENGSYTYQEFGGLTEKGLLASSIDYLLENGALPEGSEQTGYVHHSCSTGKCYENCIVKNFEYPSLMDIEKNLTDLALDCLGAQAAEAFKDAYSAAKQGDCAYTCASADSPRDWGDCVQCGISETIGQLPGAGCVVDLWGWLGDLLEPHADCLAECAAPSSTWSDNYGHPCRDYQGQKSQCNGDVLEEYGCRDCEWVVTNVYVCDDGCEMTADGAVCKGKCKEEWCDDGDDCTIDWCYKGECKHVRDDKPGCGCPESCDDGNRCTTDYCDENYNCQHTKKPGCCPTSCDDGDNCTRDWCDASGSCRHSRVPGCDHPDDNNDYSTFPEYGTVPIDEDADIAVLNNGFSDLTLMSLHNIDRTTAIIEPSLLGLQNYDVLVIPSGGLAGLDTSELFRERLWSFVENGGTLISFAQQLGSEFEVLPGGEIEGYGWIEDQSCNGYNAVNLVEYHPIFSGLNTTNPYANVDGFFTRYPLGASVLLIRVKNGQPAMLAYEYGEGRVLTTTLYMDMSRELYQNTSSERTMMRDILSWAEAESDIATLHPEIVELDIPVTNPQPGTAGASAPSFQPGDLVELTIEVENNGAVPADSVTFALYDPSFDRYDVAVTADIPGGTASSVNVTYQTDPDAETGVWTVLYFLYDGTDAIHAGYGGEFTLGYDITAASAFQTYITVTDPNGDVVLDEGKPLDIPPGETGTLSASFIVTQSSQWGIWNARYSVLAADGSVLMSSRHPFAVSRCDELVANWGYQERDINFSVTSDKDAYLEGESGNFTIHFWNHSETPRTVTFWYSFPHNYWGTHNDIYGAPGTTRPGLRSNLHETVVIPAGSGDTAGYTSFDYIVPLISFDRLWADFYEGDETSKTFLGNASRGIHVSRARIWSMFDMDRTLYTPGENVTVTLTIRNYNDISIDYTADVFLQDPDGAVLSTETFSGSADPQAFESRDFTFSLPGGAILGTYVVGVKINYRGAVIGGNTYSFSVKHLFNARLTLNKNAYAARGTMQVTAAMNNPSTVPWEGDVQLEIPDIGYLAAEHVSLPAGGSHDLVFDDIAIPDDILEGSHHVYFRIPAEDYETRKTFFIRPPDLSVAIDQVPVYAGASISMRIENSGGVDTSAECHILLAADPASTVQSAIDVRTDQTEYLFLPVDLATPGGLYHVSGYCEDLRTGNTVSTSKTIEIIGSELSVFMVNGDAYNAGDTVSVGVKNTGVVGTGYECTVHLRDGSGTMMQTANYNGTLPQGENVTLPFVLPAQLVSGAYHLNAGCTDTTSDKKSSLQQSLIINGLELSLTSVTDREMYITSDTVTLQSHIGNAGPALTEASLKLKVWQTVESETGGGSEVSEDWVARYVEVRRYQSDYDITRDDAGNIFITGSVYDSTSTYADILTVKYDAEGVEQWAATYDGTGGRSDYANAIAVDSTGNVYVTGSSEVLRQGSLTQYHGDIVTIKYNASGTQQWVARYDGGSQAWDEGNDIAVDENGDVYVTGYRYYNGNRDYITIKYDGDTENENGAILWDRFYDGAGYWDTAEAMVVAGDKVYVTGTSRGTLTDDYLTIAYTTDGDEVSSENWPARYDGDGAQQDEAKAITVDSAGNVYVTGRSIGGEPGNANYDTDFVTVKYNADGEQQWAAPFVGPFKNDTGRYIAVDDTGNVYVTGDCDVGGYGEVSISGICTMKYDSDGYALWSPDAAIIENQSSSWMYETGVGGLSLDADGNPYITGTTLDANGIPDTITVKYAPSDGSEIWGISYGDSESEDFATGIIVGGDNAVYVVGYSDYTGEDYATTIRYIQGGGGTIVLQWEKVIDPVDVPAGGSDDIDTTVSIMGDLHGVTGKLYHVAELYNTDGQLIATSDIDTFYIVDTGLALTLETDKEFYRPGETVLVTGQLLNMASAPDSGVLTVSMDGVPIYTTSFNLQTGESLGFSTSAAAGNADFLLEGTAGAVTVSDIIEVRTYNVNVAIMAPDVVGLDPFNTVLSIVNGGEEDYDAVHVSLDGFTSWDISLPAGETVLLEAEVQIAASTTLRAELTGDVIMTAEKPVVMGESAVLAVTPDDSYPAGMVAIPFTLNNTGLVDVFAEIVFSLDAQSENISAFAAAGTAVTDNVSFQLLPGAYTLEYQSAYGSGIKEIIVTGGPEFEVTGYPDNLDLIVGDPTWNFTVKNVGGAGGFVEFYLKMPDWESTRSAWLEAGEEVVFTFIFNIPDDLEAGDYNAWYEMNGERYSFTFHVTGPKLAVVPSLDKDFYEAGDTATLTLEIENVSDFDLELFATAILGTHEEVLAFSLDAHASTTQRFDVPVTFDQGKLFYGIYQTSGRALHLNALYLYECGPLGLSTDAQVYDIGDTVTITMETQQEGTVNITAPGYAENFTLPQGTTERVFTLPNLVSGTHYIDYIFEGDAGRYPFDVRGYSGRIMSFDLDKSIYQYGNKLTVTAVADVRLPSESTMSCSVLDEWGMTIGEFSVSPSLASGQNTITADTVFNGTVAGLYSVQCRLYADLTGQSLFLASAAQYFDAGGANTAPITSAGIPYSATEGAVVLFNADAFDSNNDLLLYRWDFDGDGTYDTDWSSDSAASYTWQDDWRGTAVVAVDDGEDISTDSVEVDIENLPPVVSLSASPINIVAGQPVAFSGSFEDSGVLDTHIIVWNFGDGTMAVGSLAASHSYASGGTYIASLIVTDDDGGIGANSLIITVTGSSGGSPGGGYAPPPDDGSGGTGDGGDDETIEETSSPAAFTIGSIDVTTGNIYVGDMLTVEILLTNSGGTSGTYPLALEIDGITIEVREVTLGAGETRTITFTAMVLVPGAHLLRIGEWSAMFEVLPLEQVAVSSGFSVSDLSITPPAADQGERVGITARVTNDGSTSATGSFILYINGVQEDTREVTLDPGDSAMVAFEVSRNVAGTYFVTLGSENGEFTIRAVETEVVGEVAGSETEEETGTDIGGLIAILIGALLVVALIVAVIYSRRRD